MEILRQPSFRRLAGIISAIAIAASGCSIDRHSSSSPKPTEIATIAPDQEIEAQRERTINETLTAYRQRFVKEHRARILLGACAGWKGDNDKIIVTLNPGAMESKDEKLSLEISSFYEEEPKPDIQFDRGVYAYEMPDGTFVGTRQYSIHIAMREGVAESGYLGTEVKVSGQSIKGKDGIWSYVDEATGEPIIKTIEADGPLDPQRVAGLCAGLEGWPNPSVQNSPAVV